MSKSRSSGVTLGLTVSILFVFLAAGCGGSSGSEIDGDSGGGTPDEAVGTGYTGIDLTTYTATSTIDAAGGEVSEREMTVRIGAGAFDDPATVGVRLSVSPPQVPGDRQMVSGWFDVALDRNVVTAGSAHDGTVSLSFAVTPPEGAAGHPGLQALAVIGDLAVPIDGTFDPGTGNLSVPLAGLPPAFQVAVVYNPNVVRLTSENIAVEHSLRTRSGGGEPWSTIEWVIDYDGLAVTAAQATKLLGFAKKAAAAYSDAGLKEPFLYKQTIGAREFWPVHLTADGSCFDGSHTADAADLAARFGRLYMDTGRIDDPKTDTLGSGLASVAHEMFHAIFATYKVPFECYDYEEAGETRCRRSSQGFNEGMATAAGYHLDQGSPAKPRTTELPQRLSRPLGFFQPADAGEGYRNQDFYVFLLRIGSFANFRQHLEALAAATLADNERKSETLADYSIALNAGQTGFGGDFNSMFALYVADRGYQRTPEGWIWPAEPAGGVGGSSFTLDGTLFDASHKAEMRAADCRKLAESVVCTKAVDAVWPLAGYLVGINLPMALNGPTDLTAEKVSGTFAVVPEAGKVRFVVFGEHAGTGDAETMARADNGETVELSGLGADHERVWLLITPSEASGTKLAVSATFRPSTEVEGWRDPSTGLVWQNPYVGGWMNWSEASAYCAAQGSGWRLPTIGELRSLFEGCGPVDRGGACAIDDGCLNSDCNDYAVCSNMCDFGGGPGAEGCYWDPALGGDCTAYWSSSVVSDYQNSAFHAQFQFGTLDISQMQIDYKVRCVH